MPITTSFPNRLLGALVCYALCLPLSACGGSGGDGDTDSPPRFEGTWEVRIKLITDECGTVLDGLPGFLDEHSISQEDGSVTLSSFANLFANATGPVREDGSFEANEIDQGDIFGDGIFCTVETGISYDRPQINEEDEQANARFVQTIECADGFFCSTSGIGTAVRVPG